jgi:uncharacterized protein YjcR
MSRKGRPDRYEIKRLYEEGGFSCSQLAKMYGVTRQSIHELLTRLNTQFRKTKPLPFVIFNGRKFTISSSTGYYRCTKSRKKHISLHRYVWETHYGEIPPGYDIHHLDRDRTNNNIENLELISHSEHSSRYAYGQNQFTVKKNECS